MKKLNLYKIAAVLFFVLFFAACSGQSGSGKPPVDPNDDLFTGSFAASKSNVNYNLTINPDLSRAAAGPASGDAYKLTVTKTGSAQTGSGTVIEVTNNGNSVIVLTLRPSFKDATPFTITINGVKITNISGAITFDDGTTMPAPGSLTSSGGGGGGGGGTTPPANVAVTGVSLKASTGLIVNGTETLAASVTPDNATNKNVTWSSSNSAVATVSASGEVKGISAGSATITVTTVDGSKTAACAVTVSAGLSGTVTPSNLADSLATLPVGSYNITLSVSSESEFSMISMALKGASNKSVGLDLSGSTVTIIGQNAFSGCTSLTSITIPNSVTSIGDRAFSGCTSLASVTIPDSVTTIGYDAFYNCTSLTSITIPDGVTRIDSRTFYGCSSLTSITIPASVKIISEGAFNECTSLAKVIFNGTILSSAFNNGTTSQQVFPGDLRDKFYATNPTNGTPGTYTRTGNTWTKQ